MAQGWEKKIEAAFAPFKRGSIGFVRFCSSEDMWTYLKGRGGQPRTQWGKQSLWVGVEKTKNERDAAKRTTGALRVLKPILHLAPDQFASTDHLEVDYRRCIIWARRLRLIEWNMSISSWRVRAEELTQLRNSGVILAQLDELHSLLNQPG